MANYKSRMTYTADPSDQELNIKRLEVKVNGNFDDAFKQFRTLVQADGILLQYRARQAYEKPSEKNRRKRREAEERRRITEAREALIVSGEWEKKQKKKEKKRLEKLELKKKAQTIITE